MIKRALSAAGLVVAASLIVIASLVATAKTSPPSGSDFSSTISADGAQGGEVGPAAFPFH